MNSTHIAFQEKSTFELPETHALRRGATIVGLLAIALIHLLDLPGKWAETRYMAYGYIAVIAVSLILAEVISTRRETRAMYAAASLSVAVLLGFIVNRTIGMPGAMEDVGNWGEPLGIASLFAESITVWVTIRGAIEMHRQK